MVLAWVVRPRGSTLTDATLRAAGTERRGHNPCCESALLMGCSDMHTRSGPRPSAAGTSRRRSSCSILSAPSSGRHRKAVPATACCRHKRGAAVGAPISPSFMPPTPSPTPCSPAALPHQHHEGQVPQVVTQQVAPPLLVHAPVRLQVCSSQAQRGLDNPPAAGAASYPPTACLAHVHAPPACCMHVSDACTALPVAAQGTQPKTGRAPAKCGTVARGPAPHTSALQLPPGAHLDEGGADGC